MVGEHGVGLGQHLAGDGDVLRHGKPGERAVGGERGEMLRLLPGQAAAEAAPAAAQPDRHEIVVGLREAGAGEAHQHAALLDPGVEALADFRRQRADIGQHDHRQLLVEECAIACCGAPRSPSRTSANGASARDR